ncbi:hypothetical protein Athai_18100 [Actinocatenispora thailandica]|uniref:Uncharacterized protein n=1 Tax=Actinocatenispora thailandica TaxID=227318 RepID=A0A7R7DMW8_9ACTN|nr:hypothetical protein Athai_18100 [Actinocatenispora thailandica]
MAATAPVEAQSEVLTVTVLPCTTTATTGAAEAPDDRARDAPAAPNAPATTILRTKDIPYTPQIAYEVTQSP